MKVSIALSNYKADKVQKNILYKIPEPMIVSFKETHKNGNEEIVNLDYQLQESQYGIFANEYRPSCAFKEGYKKADVMTCVVDEDTKEIYSLIFDVKSNISSFSDDLSKENAALTAVKEVRDFIDQIHAEILHKNSFMVYYKDDDYQEVEEIAIVTKNFDAGKFRAVADFMEKLYQPSDKEIPILLKTKLMTNLAPFKNEVKKVRNFADHIVFIRGKEYYLKVFLLDKISEKIYSTTIPVKAGNFDKIS